MAFLLWSESVAAAVCWAGRRFRCLARIRDSVAARDSLAAALETGQATRAPLRPSTEMPATTLLDLVGNTPLVA